jgi:hypothetical protein
MKEMLLTYDELKDDGPVSVQRVRDVAERAANKGVAWPGALFALLDGLSLSAGALCKRTLATSTAVAGETKQRHCPHGDESSVDARTQRSPSRSDHDPR